MKTKIIRKAKEMGGTLLVTLFICTILGASTVGYLALTEQQNAHSVRSQSWNLTIALVEAGLEEGLQQLNENFDNLGAAGSGWAPYGANAYVCDRTLPGGSYRVFLYLTNGISSPVILSTATVDMSQLASARPSSFFAAVGVKGDADYITRTVRVTCYRGADFPNAIVAKEGIKMNGNNVKVDSFRSCDWPDGKYSPSRALSKGDVASNGSLIDAGNANIYGHVATGAGGTVEVGSQGAVGSYEWQAAGNKGIQPGWFSDTSNFIFKDTTLPTQGLTALPGGGLYPTPNTTVTGSTFTSPTYPTVDVVGGVITNTTALSSPTIPVGTSYTTVTNPTTTTYPPNPMPAETVTNKILVTTASYPAAGTYVGLVSTNKAGNKIKNYTYNQITGYTYPVVSYTYTQTTYTYSLYSTNTTYTTNYYDHILYGGNKDNPYYATSLSGSTLVEGDAYLVLPNGLDMSSGLTIKVDTSAKLTIYAGGTSCNLSGNQVFNQTGLAANFSLYCAPSVTDFTLSGNASFTGVVYAPNAALKFNGGGSDTLDFIGALVVKSITLNGHFNVHYDECLIGDSSKGLFVIKSWDELY